MEIPGTKCFIPKGFELGTTLRKPNGSMAKHGDKFPAMILILQLIIKCPYNSTVLSNF